jgi:hypothetical protein
MPQERFGPGRLQSVLVHDGVEVHDDDEIPARGFARDVRQDLICGRGVKVAGQFQAPSIVVGFLVL